jgi:hypothetical protein
MKNYAKSIRNLLKIIKKPPVYQFFKILVPENNNNNNNILGSMLLRTTNDNDQIIFCEYINFVVINFFFSKNKIL